MLNLFQHLTFWTHLVRSRIKSGMTGPVLENLFWTRVISDWKPLAHLYRRTSSPLFTFLLAELQDRIRESPPFVIRVMEFSHGRIRDPICNRFEDLLRVSLRVFPLT
jgi:hypothetical protein